MGLGAGLDIYAVIGSFQSCVGVGWEHGGKCQSRGVWERTEGSSGALSEQHLLCDIPFALKKVALVEFLLLFLAPNPGPF